jgi:hypothetical protein
MSLAIFFSLYVAMVHVMQCAAAIDAVHIKISVIVKTADNVLAV